MKKCYIELVAIVIALLMMSTVTAVPQINSKSLMNKINDVEQKRNFLEEKITVNFCNNIRPCGLIDLLIQLITLLIQLVFKIIQVVQDVIGLVNLIQNLIDALTNLFQLIQDLFELLQEIFNPEPLKSFQ